MTEKKPGYPVLLIPAAIVDRHVRRQREKELKQLSVELNRQPHTYIIELSRQPLDHNEPPFLVDTMFLEAEKTRNGFMYEIPYDDNSRVLAKLKQELENDFLLERGGAKFAAQNLVLYTRDYSVRDGKLIRPETQIRIPLHGDQTAYDSNGEFKTFERRLFSQTLNVRKINELLKHADNGYSLDLKFIPTAQLNQESSDMP